MERYKTIFQSKITLEVFWWVFTLVVILLVLTPIFRDAPDFPFIMENAIAIVVFITLSRYIFLLNLTFLTRHLILKIVLGIACIPLVFYLVSNINQFQTYLDEEGVLGFMGHLSPSKIEALEKYLRHEFVLFGVGSVVAATIMPFRLIIAVWRQFNRKEKL